MTYGIATLSIIPVRKIAAEQAEMTTQILFGEYFEVLKLEQKWSYIKLAYDGYEGWIDNKMYNKITKRYYKDLVSQHLFITEEINTVSLQNEKMLISCGSILPSIDQNGSFKINNKEYIYKGELIKPKKTNLRNNIIVTAKKYLNTPYIWGGKSSFGIDCSGLTQMAYKINNLPLPRDASQQTNKGKIVSFDQKLSGDLAFFEDANKKITHVGIILNSNQIIHASGKVRIDTLDNNGILNSELQIYTHKLSHINTYIS